MARCQPPLPPEDDDVCAICLVVPQASAVATLSGCIHRFCCSCILDWSKVENRCPVCKQRFHAVRSGAREIRVGSRDQRVPYEETGLRGTEEEDEDYGDDWRGGTGVDDWVAQLAERIGLGRHAGILQQAMVGGGLAHFSICPGCQLLEIECECYAEPQPQPQPQPQRQQPQPQQPQMRQGAEPPCNCPECLERHNALAGLLDVEFLPGWQCDADEALQLAARGMRSWRALAAYSDRGVPFPVEFGDPQRWRLFIRGRPDGNVRWVVPRDARGRPLDAYGEPFATGPDESPAQYPVAVNLPGDVQVTDDELARLVAMAAAHRRLEDHAHELLVWAHPCFADPNRRAGVPWAVAQEQQALVRELFHDYGGYDYWGDAEHFALACVAEWSPDTASKTTPRGLKRALAEIAHVAEYAESFFERREAPSPDQTFDVDLPWLTDCQRAPDGAMQFALADAICVYGQAPPTPAVDWLAAVQNDKALRRGRRGGRGRGRGRR